MTDFDGLTVGLYFDPEDEQGWLAYINSNPEISAFAGTPETALAELRIAYAGVKEAYADLHQQGKKLI